LQAHHDRGGPLCGCPSCRDQCVLCVCGVRLACLPGVGQSTVQRWHGCGCFPHRARRPRDRSCDWAIATRDTRLNSMPGNGTTRLRRRPSAARLLIMGSRVRVPPGSPKIIRQNMDLRGGVSAENKVVGSVPVQCPVRRPLVRSASPPQRMGARFPVAGRRPWRDRRVVSQFEF
jgi:hypothetical protein